MNEDKSDTSWFSEALCRETDPYAFHPELGESAQPAKAICALCPVRERCLRFALENEEWYGVWGGLTGQERRRRYKPRGVWQLRKAA